MDRTVGHVRVLNLGAWTIFVGFCGLSEDFPTGLLLYLLLMCLCLRRGGVANSPCAGAEGPTNFEFLAIVLLQQIMISVVKISPISAQYYDLEALDALQKLETIVFDRPGGTSMRGHWA